MCLPNVGYARHRVKVLLIWKGGSMWKSERKVKNWSSSVLLQSLMRH